MATQRSPIQPINRTNLVNTPVTSFGSDPHIYGSAHNESIGDTEFVNRRVKRKHKSQDSPDSSSIIGQMKEMFSTYEAQQNTKYEKLIEPILAIKDQNVEIQKSIDFLSSKYDEVMDKMLTLEQKNKAYEQRIESLENKIEQLERNARTSSIEIRNIPKQASENKSLLKTIVKKVSEVIEQPLSGSDIHDIFRLRTKNESNNHIVVNFTTTSCKDGFINQCRSYNKSHKEDKLNTTHLGLPGSSKPVYIDESLTSLGRRLAFLARQFVKENNYHSTWTSYGKVFLRKSQDSPALRIDCELDISKLSHK